MKKMVLFAALLSLSCSGYTYAADSTAFDPTKVRIQAQNSIPVGTVIAWHSTGNPADMRNPDGTYNWLECNGQRRFRQGDVCRQQSTRNCLPLWGRERPIFGGNSCAGWIRDAASGNGFRIPSNRTPTASPRIPIPGTASWPARL